MISRSWACSRSRTFSRISVGGPDTPGKCGGGSTPSVTRMTSATEICSGERAGQ
ncbi:hypothetical protein [Herbidospora galbida]|uniref:hypothetical protein n=1 Tax=Herbidospora galbida TaxID=2575442 RepID=UPI001FE7B571|nr:hypothetical protein [Herbidospora galbida]